MTRKDSKPIHINPPSKKRYPPLIKGIYNDCLRDPQGKHLWESGWQNNRVVDRCYRLLAALMKREPGFSGILYWAVGEGIASWDRLIPSPDGNEEQLAGEITRKALAVEDMLYLDGNHNIVEAPTARLQISATFTREELGGEGVQSLREFGLFGGDATASINSGWMIDYVIHPRIPLSQGMTLSRDLHLTFGGTKPEEGSSGFGSTLPVIAIDGVGEQFSDILKGIGVNTLNELIALDPLQTLESIPGVKLREFRAKARMVANFRAGSPLLASLADHSISALLKADPEALAEEINTPAVTANQVMQMQEELAFLQVALDDAALQKISPNDLLNT